VKCKYGDVAWVVIIFTVAEAQT